jgi:hypothetical protein
MENLIVVHMKDGRSHKGITHDFEADRESFHLLLAEGGGVPLTIRLDDMKALFYVRDYIGNRDFVARKKFDEAQRAGRRAILTFQDGEEIWGTLGEGADADGVGFVFYPADREDNNLKVFVIRSSVKSLREVTN